MVRKVLQLYLPVFIDSARFAASSLYLVDNPAEGIQRIKYKDCDCFLEYESVIDNWVKYVSLAVKIKNTYRSDLKKRSSFPI